MSVAEKIKSWYRGTYIPPPENDPHSSVVLLSLGRYEQPLLAKILGALGRFWLAHWQWIIGTTIAIVSAWIAL